MKRVLIISYQWPPSGGISVLRILKFVKYLRKFSWEPIVCVPQGANYLYTDSNSFKDIPAGLKILKVRIVEPFKAFKLISGRKKSDTNNPFYGNNKKSVIDDFAVWFRGNFFIPDARYLWIKPTVKYLSSYIEENHIDAILTDGPPHTNTVIGQILSKKYNIPWLADFQDPWTQVDYYKKFKMSKRADRKHRKLEQAVFETASKITIASASWANDLESIGARNVSVVYYGFDEDDFNGLGDINHDDSFTIAHTGILGVDRKPDVLFKVLADLCESNIKFKQKLKIKFAGPVDPSIKECITNNSLDNNYYELGNLTRVEALKLSLSSKLLLLPINKAENAKGRIPGKLYEYLRTLNTIVCMGPKDGDVANILKRTSLGKTFAYDDYLGMKQFIYDLFIENRHNKFVDISEFTNENQTKKIAKYLDEISE